MGELSNRVSDADREQAVVALRDHLLAGRLTLEEFSERVDAAYRARTDSDLVRVEANLPAIPAQGRKPARLTGAFFGRVVRRGRLRLRRRTHVFSVFADVDFDLREAEIESATTAVNIAAYFGNVDVYVPERVNIDVGGFTLFGHRREWGREAARPAAPLVRVRAIGLFGTVDVWRVPPGMQGTYSEIFRQLKAQQRQLPELSP